MRLLSFSIVASILASSSIALAQEPSPLPTPEPDVTSSVDHRQSMWRFELGYRGSFVSDAGLDPFSKNDVVPQLSLAASRTIWTRGRFSFAPGLAWDHAGLESTARGDATTLTLNRVSAPLEGRAHFGAWGYAFLRAAPGLMNESVSISDTSSPALLAKNRWVFATDVSVGWAALVWPREDASSTHARTWLQADAGYGWAATERLALAPDLPSNDPTRTGSVDLGSLALRGPFLRVAASISF